MKSVSRFFSALILCLVFLVGVTVVRAHAGQDHSDSGLISLQMKMQSQGKRFAQGLVPAESEVEYEPEEGEVVEEPLTDDEYYNVEPEVEEPVVEEEEEEEEGDGSQYDDEAGPYEHGHEHHD